MLRNRIRRALSRPVIESVIALSRAETPEHVTV